MAVLLPDLFEAAPLAPISAFLAAVGLALPLVLAEVAVVLLIVDSLVLSFFSSFCGVLAAAAFAGGFLPVIYFLAFLISSSLNLAFSFSILCTPIFNSLKYCCIPILSSNISSTVSLSSRPSILLKQADVKGSFSSRIFRSIAYRTFISLMAFFQVSCSTELYRAMSLKESSLEFKSLSICWF